jgi:hypothetical protein
VDKLITPFLLGAIVLSIAVVMVELGTGIAPRLLGTEDPPGIAIMALALIDAQLVFATVFYGLGVVLPHGLVGRVQGCAGCVLSIVLIILSILTIILAILLLLLMVALIASFFGIIVYFAVFGNFARTAAAAILFLLLVLKLAMAACLVLAHRRFLQNIGLVLLVLFSLVGNVIVSILHGIVPRVLVSATDAIAAIIVGIIGLIWAIALLIGSIIGIVRVLQLNKPKVPELPQAVSSASRATATPPGQPPSFRIDREDAASLGKTP